MSKFIYRSILTSLAICNLLIAQDQSPAPMRQFQRGDRALQFGVRGLFNLSSFQGSTISYKRHLSSKTALRIGLDLSLDNHTSEGSEERNRIYRRMDFRDSTDYTISEEETYDLETERKYMSIGIVTQWIMYPVARGELQPYWGIGPTAHYSNSNITNELSSMDSTADPRASRSKVLSYDFGVSAVFGLEWFFRNSMSLNAEYLTSCLVRYSDTDQYSEYTYQNVYYDSDGEVTRWYIETRESKSNTKSSSPDLVVRSMMKFGISLYF